MGEFRYLSTDPLLPVSSPCTRSALAVLSTLIPVGSVLSHQDASFCSCCEVKFITGRLQPGNSYKHSAKLIFHP